MSSRPPESLRAFAARSSVTGAAPRAVRIEQHGAMWLRPGGRPLAFTAVQHFSAERVAFDWQARFAIAGVPALGVRDGYRDGAGELAVRLLGVPLQRQRGPEVTAGEVLRYLAELPFVPPAILHSRELDWRETGERSVEVATRVTGRRLAVSLELDDAGDVCHASSSQRLRKTGGTWQPIAWGGDFRSYADLGGLWIPTEAEAYWDLPAGRWVYWRAEIVDAATA